MYILNVSCSGNHESINGENDGGDINGWTDIEQDENTDWAVYDTTEKLDKQAKGVKIVVAL